MAKKGLFDRKKFTEAKYEGVATKEEYRSSINYDELEVSKEDEEKLIEYEKVALENSKRIKEHLFNLAEIFYEAQKLLSSKDNTKGKFLKWIEGIGFGKSFVYETLDRYNIYLEHNNKKIFELPVRAMREIKKLPSEKAIEVMNSENPSNKIKELKEVIEEIEEAVVINNSLEYRLSVILNRLEEIKKEENDLLQEKRRIELKLKNN
ncbi:MAG: hypothetical protein ACRDDH_17450 [Cetobacterium sp.]|uniref:hypothetical protein n=2 Tax=Cetobacterium sp. TaxID=2071632 RepID=UPI003EE803A3